MTNMEIHSYVLSKGANAQGIIAGIRRGCDGRVVPELVESPSGRSARLAFIDMDSCARHVNRVHAQLVVAISTEAERLHAQSLEPFDPYCLRILIPANQRVEDEVTRKLRLSLPKYPIDPIDERQIEPSAVDFKMWIENELVHLEHLTEKDARATISHGPHVRVILGLARSKEQGLSHEAIAELAERTHEPEVFGRRARTIIDSIKKKLVKGAPPLWKEHIRKSFFVPVDLEGGERGYRLDVEVEDRGTRW